MRLVSRSGQTMNPTYPELVEVWRRRSFRDLVADGEIVAFERGRTSFARLQRRMQIHDPERARRSGVAVYLYLFDLLEIGGEDLRPLPCASASASCAARSRFRDRLRWTPYRVGDGEAAYRHACAHGWEGVIAKRADSPYVPARSRDWRKIKCSARPGARDRRLDRRAGRTTPARRAAARILGRGPAALRRQGRHRVRRAGGRPLGRRAGAAGARRRRRSQTRDFPAALAGQSPSWSRRSRSPSGRATGRLRHPRYLGLRDDKPAREVVRELARG